MGLTITFNSQWQSISAPETDLQGTRGSVFSNPRLQQGIVFSSAGTDFRAPTTRSYSTTKALRNDDNGIGAYVEARAARGREICEAAQTKFLDLARSEYFEYGYTPPSEHHLLQFAREYPGLVGEVIQNIYLAELADTCVMLALLNAVASLDYEAVRPYGQVLAVAALSNPVAEIKEAAIRVYETWGHTEGAKILASVECPWAWLDDYRKQVISDLGRDA